jgi:hypothetical protein
MDVIHQEKCSHRHTRRSAVSEYASASAASFLRSSL